MHVPGLGSAANVPPALRGPSPQPVESQRPAEAKSSEDRVEISAEAVEPGTASEVRALRLAQIKAAIEAGEYETQDKLDAALSRLFEEIGLDDEEESSE